MVDERDYRVWNGYVVLYNGEIMGPRGRRIKGTRTSKGYLQTTGPKKKKLLLHRIVAAAWHAHTTDDIEAAEVNHIDGNKGNNRVDNLEIVSPAEHAACDNERRVQAFIAGALSLQRKPNACVTVPSQPFRQAVPVIKGSAPDLC